MTNFIPLQNDPISQYIRDNYRAMRIEFFEEWFPATVSNKPQYRRTTGSMLYENTIRTSAAKLSKTLLDKKELEIVNFPPFEKFIYPLKKNKPEIYNKMPTWAKLLDEYDNVIEQLFVNTAYPGSSISSHYGVSSHCYRLHLCLQTNPGFIFNIGDESKQWIDGPSGMFIFDDGPMFHGVEYNKLIGTSQARIVAIFDIIKEYYDVSS